MEPTPKSFIEYAISHLEQMYPGNLTHHRNVCISALRSAISGIEKDKDKTQKKVYKIGHKRSKETVRHLVEMDKLDNELLEVQKECKHEMKNGYCVICGAINIK